MFDWLHTQPEKLASFGAAMAAANHLKIKGVLSTLSRLFPSANDPKSIYNERDVLLVDVGGGKGKLLERFRKERPDLVGRMILQDLSKVIEGREMVPEFECMVHDFLTPQPIRGKQFNVRCFSNAHMVFYRSTYLLFPPHFSRLA